jgi:hypothetical protein
MLRSFGCHTFLFGFGTSCIAAITPSWRVNPITPAAIQFNPVLANACSLSLVVSLTGESLFSVAGLRIDQVDLPGAQYFQQVPFGSDTLPGWFDPNLFPDFPYDTHVFTTQSRFGQPPGVPGRYVGVGVALVGRDGVFNAAWGAMPATGPFGGTNLEIARITFLNAGPISQLTMPVLGEVRSSDEPNVAIPIPPMPLPAAFVPEPASGFFLAASMAICARRNSRRTNNHSLEVQQ